MPDAEATRYSEAPIIVDLGQGGDDAALVRVDYLATNGVNFLPRIAVHTDENEIRIVGENKIYNSLDAKVVVVHLPPNREYLGPEIQLAKIVGQRRNCDRSEQGLSLHT